MKMPKHAEAGLFLFAITTSGLSLADCPGAMPEQLLVDCIVYEGSGSTFPSSDYAYMGLYNTWLNSDDSTAMHRQSDTTAKNKTMK